MLCPPVLCYHNYLLLRIADHKYLSILRANHFMFLAHRVLAIRFLSFIFCLIATNFCNWQMCAFQFLCFSDMFLSGLYRKYLFLWVLFDIAKLSPSSNTFGFGYKDCREWRLSSCLLDRWLAGFAIAFVSKLWLPTLWSNKVSPIYQLFTITSVTCLNKRLSSFGQSVRSRDLKAEHYYFQFFY